jgi:hypothetical protein
MYVVYSNELAFQPANADGTPAGREEIVKRGAPVPEYVAPYVINALVSAGMIVFVAQPDPSIRPLEAEPLPPVSADQPPGPSGPALADLGTGMGDIAPAVPFEKPKPNDSRSVWEQYGVGALGLDQLTLEALPNKAAVIEAVNDRETSGL